MTAVIDPAGATDLSPSSPTTRRWKPPAVQVTAGAQERALATGLAALVGLVVWLIVFAVGFSALVEHHDQHVLYSRLRAQLANQSAPVSAPIGRGDPVVLLSAPHLGTLVVVAGTTSAELRSGPGLSPGSHLPGQPGATTIAGRSSTYGGPFGHAHQLRLGDRITATTGEGVSTYRVVGNSLAGDQVPAAYLAATAKMRLVTSNSSGLLGMPTPGRTRFVYAVLTGTPLAPGAVGQSSRDDAFDHVHPAGLYPLVLWLQGLLLVVVGAAYALVRTARRYRAHVWLVAAPLGLAALWGASDALFGVLPNLL